MKIKVYSYQGRDALLSCLILWQVGISNMATYQLETNLFVQTMETSI
jgi:hypothetical protein